MHTITGISDHLNTLINNLLAYDTMMAMKLPESQIDKDVKSKGEAAEKELIKMGIIDADADGMFVEPDALKGEAKIAAQWLKDNI